MKQVTDGPLADDKEGDDPLTPDLSQAKQFLHRLDPNCTKFCFQTFDDSKRKDRLLARVLHGELDNLAQNLTDLNAQGAGVFITVNPTDGQARKRENITGIRAAWQEDDDGFSGQFPLEPHLVVESSPGKFHRYWLVDGMSFEQHQTVMDRMVASFASDRNARDLSRVMRLPGFHHQKGTPHLVGIVQDSGAARYSAEQVIAAFPPVSEAKKRGAKQAPVRSPAPGNRNTSLASMAGRLRRRGADKALIADALNKVNDDLTEPLSADEVSGIAGSISKYDSVDSSLSGSLTCSIERHPCSDAGLAERFAELKGNDLRWVAGLNAWIRWGGVRWIPAEAVIEDAIAVARSINIEAATEFDDTRRNTLQRLAMSAESRGRLEGMLAIASQFDRLRVNAARFDQCVHLIGSENGVVDLRSMRLVKAHRDQWITKTTGINYIPSAKCPRFKQFMLEIMGGDKPMVAFLQRLIGAFLIAGNRDQILAIFHGLGANGKSVLLDCLRTVFGDYYRSMSPETLMSRQRGNAGGAREDLARLHGARLVVAVESREGDFLDEELIKAMTGGDSLVARIPYAKSSLEFVPVFMPLLITNHKPVIRGTDYAIWRRMVLIPFEESFKGKAREAHLIDKLVAEREGILRWVVQGAAQYLKKGLDLPQKVQMITEEYRSDMDLLQHWIDENCLTDPMLEEFTYELYKNYKYWADEGGLRPYSKINFSRKLSDRGFGTRPSHGKAMRMGIALRKEARTPW
jgi:putative DNA primase/helicase